MTALLRRLLPLFPALALMPLTACISATAVQPTPASHGCQVKGRGSASPDTTIKVIYSPSTVGTYSPLSLTSSQGQTVQWVWSDKSSPHTVTSDTGVFNSCVRKYGATFAVTFDQAGTFPYHCDIHPGMVGILNVKNAS
jgi:plastocyanin